LKTLKGLTITVLFLIVAILVEYVVVVYAMSLGVKDNAPIQWSFIFPGTESTVMLTVSPLFHLVPIAVIVALTFSWTYLARHMVVRRQEAWKGKSGHVSKQEKEQKASGKLKLGLFKSKKLSNFVQRIRYMRPTLRSAFAVFLVFAVFILVASLLAYPQMIYRIVTGAFQNDSSLLNFFKGAGQALASVGAVFSSINYGLLSIAPGLRDFGLSIGNMLGPLAASDNAGKYLFFQTFAVWFSGLLILFYGEFMYKSVRYRKAGKN
jgi:hypothetical protein